MTLKQEIQDNWRTDISGNIQDINLLKNTPYPAWTVKFDDAYGVAIPYTSSEDLNETFANARIRSCDISTQSDEKKRVLVLTATSKRIQTYFASLCEALIDPGENGAIRNQINSSPITWWKDWKELLGNKNIDSRIYDTLGELCVLKYSILHGEEANWIGPEGASYDIETLTRFLEVKSSTVRSKKHVTISSQYQLFPHKPLFLVYCLFEPTISSGVSIDSILDEFEAIGYNTSLLNEKLEAKGFEKGMSSRKKMFILHEMLLYTVDDSFPRITPASFENGVLPENIVDISYTVDLAGLPSISLLQGDSNEIQND